MSPHSALRNAGPVILAAMLLGACANAPGPISRAGYPETKNSRLPENRENAESSALRSELIVRAMGLIGIPYRSGGSNPETGFDCSGLVHYVFSQTLGMDLPHNSDEIAHLGEALALEQLQIGDLVFYNTLGKANSHVGIYLGDGRFIHAPSTRGQVRIENMNLSYWTQRYNGARRLLS